MKNTTIDYENLQKLRRRNDPESRQRLGRELMRSGIIYGHIDDFCLLAEYLNALENSNDPQDQDIARNERHLIFRKWVNCMAPLDVVALLHEDDEGFSHVEGVFTTIEAAQRHLCDRVFRRGQLSGEDLLDFTTAYKQKDYREAISIIQQTLGTYWFGSEQLLE